MNIRLGLASSYRLLYPTIRIQSRRSTTLSSLFNQPNTMLMDETTNFEATPVPTNLIPSLQKPVQQVLWIGCSDSCFQETKILDLLPDEMLVHRNLGNMLIEGDLSSETTIKHAVANLKVKHIVVCGHYGCGIVRAESRDGLNGPWLSQLNSLHSTFKDTMNHLSANNRDRAFVEMNVFDQLRSLRKFPEVRNATETRGLQLHGLVYDTNSGNAFKLKEGL